MSVHGSGGRRAAGTEADWLTLGQAAKYLGVAQSTIRKWSDQGLLSEFYTPGGDGAVPRRDLEAFAARAGRGGPGPVVLIVDDGRCVRRHVRVSLEADG